MFQGDNVLSQTNAHIQADANINVNMKLTLTLSFVLMLRLMLRLMLMLIRMKSGKKRLWENEELLQLSTPALLSFQACITSSR
jgi:hypothetical protein